jgi:heptosyltransferase-2
MKILIIQQKNDRGCIGKQHYMQQPPTRYPNAQIDYLVYESTSPVLEGNPNIDTIIVLRRKAPKSKRITESNFEIRANKYDLLIDAYSKLESWLVVLLSGAKEAYLIRKRTHFSIY